MHEASTQSEVKLRGYNDEIIIRTPKNMAASKCEPSQDDTASLPMLL